MVSVEDWEIRVSEMNTKCKDLKFKFPQIITVDILMCIYTFRTFLPASYFMGFSVLNIEFLM